MAMSTIVLFARLYVHAHLLRGKSGEILCIRLDRAGRKLMRIEGGDKMSRLSHLGVLQQ